jgi:ribokinase
VNTNSILVIGSSNTDMVVKSTKLPLPGETLMGGSFFMNAGGKGANQAVAAARLGGNVTLVTKVGNDIFGEQSIAGFKKENIQTGFVFVDEEAPSGTALIMVNEEGENCIVVAPGANANLLPVDIKDLYLINNAAIILMQLEIPMETIEAVIKMAKVNHQKVVINPAPAQILADKLLDGLFLITPNETEATFLTGIKVADAETASQAASVFLNKGVQNIIITMGKQGAFFQNKKNKLMIPAPIVKALDTTAAGDTFSGAITVALTENMDWETAIKFAIEAASIAVTRLGAQASVPYRSEIKL